MEYLDVYDENRNYIGKEARNVVHRDALWHNTVHCWLYDNEGNVYFQIRKDEGKLYTTASGHIKAGETVKQGFGREVAEEIGLKINYNNAELVEVNKFTLDKKKNDGTLFRDRAFANVYVCDFEGKYDEFNFDPDELDGLVKVNAKEALDLLKSEKGNIHGTVIKNINGKNVEEKQYINFENFLVNKGETGIGKYGKVLNKVIELTNK